MFSPDLTVFWDDSIYFILERYDFTLKGLTKLWNDRPGNLTGNESTIHVQTSAQTSFISCFSLRRDEILNRDVMVHEEIIEGIKPARDGISGNQILKYLP